MEDLFKASTYSDDIELFEELGLHKFENIENWKEIFLGEVDRTAYTIKVWVETAPAQFWRFEVYNKEADKITYKVGTGSGTLSQYWPTIENLSEGMLVVERVNQVDI